MEFRKKMISILLLSVLLTAQPVSETALLNLTSLNVSAAETFSRAERLSPEEQEIVITADDPEGDALEPSAAPGISEETLQEEGADPTGQPEMMFSGETEPEESPEEIVITADDPEEDAPEPSAAPGGPEETPQEESPEEIVITADDPEEDAPEPSAAPGVSEETQPEESPEEIVLPEDPLSGGEQPDTELLPEGELPHDSALPPEGELPDGPALLEEEGATEMLIPVEEGEADTDNDDVFAAYVNREMELTGDLKADTGGVTVTLKAANGKGLVTITVGSAQYTGKTLKPAVRVTCSGTVLKSGTDYTVTYSNSKNAGTNTAKVSVTGKNAYSGSVTKSFSIAKAKQSLTVKTGATAVAVGKTTRLTASGAKETSRYTFTSSNRAVASVNGSGRVTAHKVGTVTITVKVPETSNYQKASKKVTVRVVPAATTKLSAANQADGVRLVWAKVPGASGYDLYRDNVKIRSFAGGNTLVYLDKTANTNGRKYVYRLVAKASTGVSPLSRSVSSWRVTRSMVRTIKSTAPGRAAVTWTKNTHCTGYVIQYALNNGFTSGRKDVTVNSPAAVSRTLTGLLRGRIYYVRIRAFRKVGNLVYSSVWSPARAVKIY